MKLKLFAIIAAAGIIKASAQTELPDTITAGEISEVTIEAPKVIRKADMDVYHPSKSAVDNSKNGVQLLRNLMIPSLAVNDPLGSIMAAGQSVQLRINGRVSTIDQVRALLPETIKRVEWIDNPGLRYGGASHVLNFIVSNPDAGGSLQASAQPALNTAFGHYMADVKLNNGPSQWEVGSFFKLTNKIDTHRDYTETITRPDGSSLTRKETSRGGTIDNSFGRVFASYSYIKPDTTVFMAEIGVQHIFSNRYTYRGLLTLSDGSDDIDLHDTHGDTGTTPSLSLY